MGLPLSRLALVVPCKRKVCVFYGVHLIAFFTEKRNCFFYCLIVMIPVKGDWVCDVYNNKDALSYDGADDKKKFKAFI